jgi:hypothetical protein
MIGWVESEDSKFLELGHDCVCCTECGCIILDSRKDVHNAMHVAIDILIQKLKPVEDYNEG